MVKHAYVVKGMVVLLSLGAFGIYLALAQYSYPSSDDYCFASNPLSLGFWGYQRYMYLNWGGRYMATLVLSAIGKLPFEHIYPFLSFSVFASTLFGFAAISAALLKKSLCSLSVWGIAVVVFTAYLGQMPSVVEAFYWMSGAYTYQMSVAILVVWTALAIKILSERVSSKSGMTMFYLLPVILLGLNETTAIVFLVVLIWFLAASYRRRPEVFRPFCIILIISGLCTATLLLAPGNAIRSSSYPALPSRHMLSFALPETARKALGFTIRHICYPSLWLSGMAIWLWGGAKKELGGIPFPNWTRQPLVWVGLAVLLVYLTLFPLYWEYGNNNLTGEGRTYNVTCFCFIAAMLVAIATSLERYISQSVRVWLESRCATHTILAVALTASLLTTPNTLAAWDSLQTAPRFLIEQLQREQIIRSTPPNGSAYVPRMQTKTKHLFWGDITEDPAYWSNQCISHYYHLKSVQSSP